MEARPGNFTPGERSSSTTVQEAVWAPELSGRSGEEYLFLVLGIEPRFLPPSKPWSL